ALCTAHRLVDHHTCVLQGAAFALCAGAQQNGAHGGGHACADRGHIGVDVLHGVVDPQACVNTATGRVQIDLDVLLRIGAFEEEQLCLYDVGHLIVDRGAKE